MLQSAQPSFGPLGLSGRGSSSGMLRLLVVAHWCGHNDGASQGTWRARIEQYLLLPSAISAPPEWNLDPFNTRQEIHGKRQLLLAILCLPQ